MRIETVTLANGTIVNRIYDSNNCYRETVLSSNEDSMPIESKLVPCEARKQARRKDAIIQAHMDYRAKQAKPVRYGKKALQAIDYLLGDKYRDKRNMQEKREDEQVKLMTGAEFSAYLDNERRKLSDAILHDKETIQTMREWIYKGTLSHFNMVCFDNMDMEQRGTPIPQRNTVTCEKVKLCANCHKKIDGNCEQYCEACMSDMLGY